MQMPRALDVAFKFENVLKTSRDAVTTPGGDGSVLMQYKLNASDACRGFKTCPAWPMPYKIGTASWNVAQHCLRASWPPGKVSIRRPTLGTLCRRSPMALCGAWAQLPTRSRVRTMKAPTYRSFQQEFSRVLAEEETQSHTSGQMRNSQSGNHQHHWHHHHHHQQEQQ